MRCVEQREEWDEVCGLENESIATRLSVCGKCVWEVCVGDVSGRCVWEIEGGRRLSDRSRQRRKKTEDRKQYLMENYIRKSKVNGRGDIGDKSKKCVGKNEYGSNVKNSMTKIGRKKVRRVTGRLTMKEIWRQFKEIL